MKSLLLICSLIIFSRPVLSQVEAEEKDNYIENQSRPENLRIHEASIKDQEKYKEMNLNRGWQKTLPPLSNFMNNYRRTDIHIHSVYSHDACDGKPFINGTANEPCFQDFQKSLCDLNTDIVFLTEHSGHLSEHPFEDAWHLQANDVPIVENGVRTGLIRTCASGHKVHLYLGSENKLMPIGLTRHPDLLPGKTLNDIYQGRDKDVVQKFREAGAIVGVAHTEDKLKPLDYLQNLGADFMEIYNLHAEFLILLAEKNVGHILDRLLNFLAFYSNPLLEPDLLYLSLQTENQYSLNKWSSIVLTQHMTGTAGVDAHQNAIPFKMWDGERGDSYRRMQKWFSNYVYAPNPEDRLSVMQSIREGKNLVVFEIYGIPEGFDFSAETLQGQVPMGDMVSNTGPYTVKLQMPRLMLDGKEATQAKLEGQILKATTKGWVLVAKGHSGTIEYQSHEPGVYRSQVYVKPDHLMKYIPGMINLDHNHVWIYSNPIWINEGSTKK